MKKFSFLIIILFAFVQTLQSQNNINNYAYVVVPDQFPFQKSVDEYQVNSLAKFLFSRVQMKSFMDNEKIPSELLGLDCAGLKMKLIKESSAFRIKVRFELLNCRNEVVFKSKMGSSTEKEYKKGYHESLRNAFKSFESLRYKYEGNLIPQIKEVSKKLNDTSEAVFSNENISIELKENNGSYIGKVASSKTMNYSEGELVCKLFKTSLPNVFRIEWKDHYGNFINTIGFFDESGNLNIDISKADGISVMTFTK